MRDRTSLTTVASLLVSLVIFLVPVWYWFERTNQETWTRRLFVPVLEAEPARHTPRFAQGTYLPAQITRDTTLAADQNPLLVAGVTVIAPGVTLTIEPGSHLYFHEFAGLQVEGTLVLRGTAAAPVRLASNEQHRANQAWSGIIIGAMGTSQITDADVEDASPGISCLPGSTLTASRVRIWRGLVGWYTASESCTLAESVITGAREGIVAVGVEPRFPGTTISAGKVPVRTAD